MRKTASRDSSTGRRRATLAASREWTMSRSRVWMGAPFSTPASPPTMTKSAPDSRSRRKISRNLVCTIEPAHFFKVGGMLFEDLQPFGGRKRKHPADERQIHSVFAIVRLEFRRQILFFGRHGSTSE